MAQAKEREGPQAFMPSSNDSLAINSFSTSRPSSQSASPHRPSPRSSSLPNESAILSPPSRHRSSDGLVSPKDMFELPSRQHVSSASSLPASESHPPSDQTFWNNQYRRALEIHESERKLWSEEKQFLERQIAWLKDELSKKRSDSGVSSFSGKENDKVFADAEVIRQSQEKLRTFSNVSSLVEQTSANGIPVTKTVQDVPMSDDYAARRHSSVSSSAFPPSTGAGKRLSSITEDDSNPQIPRRVSVNDNGRTITEIIPDQILNVEGPPSPPTTARIPTPPNAKTHAGRTPPVPRSPLGEDMYGEEPATAVPDPAPVYENVDDDPELNSPKMLPNAPKDGFVPELSDLNKRLETVAADPEGNPPEAVRSGSASPIPPTNGAGHDNEFGGVKLKTKRSMNFGAPLGNLRMG